MSPVLRYIAEDYLGRRAARTGTGVRDLIYIGRDLLRAADASHGIQHEAAIHDLETCERVGLLVLERSKREASLIQKVRLPLEKAEAFLRHCGFEAPSENRSRLVELFNRAAGLEVPEKWKDSWLRFCLEMAEAVGKGQFPFDCRNPEQVRLQLQCAGRLLDWSQESYLRFASCVLCGDSKTLGKWQPRLEAILAKVTDGEIPNFAALGITETGGGCWVHGPATLRCEGGEIPLDATALPLHLSRTDLQNALRIAPETPWLTVENETVLFELARLRSGTFLLSSGFRGGMANTAVVDLIRKSPPEAEVWHFGDSDPTGFDILRDLRERTGRSISSFQMRYRASNPPVPLTVAEQNRIRVLLASASMSPCEKEALQSMLTANDKGCFEQESLGIPCNPWPFYSDFSATR